MKWDGTYIDLEAYNQEGLLQISINGQTGVVANKIHLKGTYQVVDYFIDGNTLVASNWSEDRGTNTVPFYRYPAGGAPILRVSKDLTSPRGVVVSSIY